MMKTTIHLLAVPDEVCKQERLDLRTLMSRGLKIEARLANGVNKEDEQRRYHILCDRMEYLGNLIGSTKLVESLELGPQYFNLVLQLRNKFPEEARETRLGSNFCPSSLVEGQINQFAELAKKAGVRDAKSVKDKIAFYQRAAANNWHVLELQELSVAENYFLDLSGVKLLEQFLAMPVADGITDTKETNAFIGLRDQIAKVIEAVNEKKPASVNFSDLAHNVIAEILHEFVYKKGKPMYLPVVYADGSKARPFPIHCIKPKEMKSKNLDDKDLLRVGMISGRHHELDSQVKIYFFLNQEISTGKTAAEIDEVAYLKAQAAFKQWRTEGVYKIAYHQTGFQPAVVGFYRALAEEIVSRRNNPITLEITPFFYFGEEYKQGKTWS